MLNFSQITLVRMRKINSIDNKTDFFFSFSGFPSSFLILCRMVIKLSRVLETVFCLNNDKTNQKKNQQMTVIRVFNHVIIAN